jgi:hypothetical protein
MPRTFQHTTHDGLRLPVSLLEYTSNSSSSTTTKSARHLKTFDGCVAAHAAAASPSSGIEPAFDAVKDAERKAKNAASAKKSRQKKNLIEANRDKEVEEKELKKQKLEDKINISKLLINAMSGLVLDTKLQIFSDSTLFHATTNTPEHGSFHQQMEQETTTTLVSFLPSINDVDEETTQEYGHVNLPLFFDANSTASQKEEEAANERSLKKADETKYSTEEVPQCIQIKVSGR